jgi:hypothetical protein
MGGLEMKEKDIIKAAVASDMPDFEAVRLKCLNSGGRRRHRGSVKWAAAAAAAIVLAAGIFIYLRQAPLLNGPSCGDDDTALGEVSGVVTDIHVNKIGVSEASMDIDAQTADIEAADVPDSLSCILEVTLPEGFEMSRLYAMYVDRIYENGQLTSHDDYDILHSYIVQYCTPGDDLARVEISASQLGWTPSCTVIDGNSHTASRIGDTEVMIYCYSQCFEAKFEYGGAYFDITSLGIEEGDFIDILCSIIK